MNSLRDVAVIIPVGPQESAWKSLLSDLETLPSEVEILLVGTAPKPSSFAEDRARWLQAPQGRARQLNFGAKSTRKKYLWFLHADSRIEKRSIEKLARALEESPTVLLFFDLLFLKDGPRWMLINELGVRLRSRVLRLPFGDQGFCVSRADFERLGGFDESAPYGEDHLFVWRAHQCGVPLRCTGAPIRTSARRYREKGWGKTTARHLVLAVRQVLPELVTLLRKRRLDVES